MGRLILAWLMVMMAAIGARAQTTEPVTEKIFADRFVDFEVDNLGNVYLVNSKRQIKKINNNFDSVGLFNDVKSFGELYGMDVSNPLKVLLFYKDFSTIVVLDRFLDTRSTIDLRRIGILQCNAIAQSYDNNIWVYDDIASKVFKIDESGNILLESADFRMLFDDPPHPHRLDDYNKQLYAYDSTKGMLVMDYFGAYRTLLPYKGWKNLHGMAKGLVATDATGVIFLQADNLNTRSQPLPPQLLQSKKIRVQANRVFALSYDGLLTVYNLPTN